MKMISMEECTMPEAFLMDRLNEVLTMTGEGR